ncbi:MAG: plasmid stabilization protein [Nitrospirota bacterium]
MPRGDKSTYADKQKRQAEHIEEGYEEQCVGEEEAARRAWATVNKTSGGGKKAGSGRGRKSAQKKSASFGSRTTKSSKSGRRSSRTAAQRSKVS